MGRIQGVFRVSRLQPDAWETAHPARMGGGWQPDESRAPPGAEGPKRHVAGGINVTAYQGMVMQGLGVTPAAVHGMPPRMMAAEPGTNRWTRREMLSHGGFSAKPEEPGRRLQRRSAAAQLVPLHHSLS